MRQPACRAKDWRVSHALQVGLLSSSFALFPSMNCPRLQRAAASKIYGDLQSKGSHTKYFSVQLPVRRNFGAALTSNPAFSEAEAAREEPETKPLKCAKHELSVDD